MSAKNSKNFKKFQKKCHLYQKFGLCLLISFFYRNSSRRYVEKSFRNYIKKLQKFYKKPTNSKKIYEKFQKIQENKKKDDLKLQKNVNFESRNSNVHPFE